jgi:hypothetical protein
MTPDRKGSDALLTLRADFVGGDDAQCPPTGSRMDRDIGCWTAWIVSQSARSKFITRTTKTLSVASLLHGVFARRPKQLKILCFVCDMLRHREAPNMRYEIGKPKI